MGSLVSLIQNNWPLISFPVCVLCCSGGLKQAFYSFGYGYALSMVSNGVCSIIANNSTLSELKQHYWTPGFAQAAGYIMFGLRLGYFLRRRHHNRAFSEKLTEKINKGSETPIYAKAAVVLSVGSLISFYSSCSYYAWKVKSWDVSSILGTALWTTGLLIQTIADEQKQAHKAISPNTPFTSGLYQYCRHPNYFGEILIHAGFYITALSGYDTWWSYILSAIGPSVMINVLTSTGQRLDVKQYDMYAESIPNFVKWQISTPSIFPFLSPNTISKS